MPDTCSGSLLGVTVPSNCASVAAKKVVCGRKRAMSAMDAGMTNMGLQ